MRSDIRTVSAIPVASLAAIAKALGDEERPLLLLDEFRGLLEKHLTEGAQVGGLQRILVYASSPDGGDPDDRAPTFLSRLTAAVSADNAFDSDMKKAFASIESHLADLADHPLIAGLAKALTLASDSEKTFSDARVITDVRPVFSSERDRIVGAVVTNTLRVDYVEYPFPRTIALTIDTRDLRQLQQAAERALKKSEVARDFMKIAKTPVTVTGDNRDD